MRRKKEAQVVASSQVQGPPVPSPEIVIQGGVVLHIGPPDGLPVEEIRARKKDGRRIIWVLTPEEMKTFNPLTEHPDEMVFGYKSDTQMKRLLHDEMHRWQGAEILPPGERIEKFAQMMGDIVDLHQFNAHSDKVLSENNLPQQNSFKNYRWVQDGIPLKRVRGMGAGKPIVILAAGPSLNDQWPYLREYRKKHPEVPFMMAGRTYKKAMQEGVWPDFVMEVEQFDWDADLFMFAPDPPPHTILAFPVTAAPRLAHVWPGQKMCLLNHNLAAYMGFTPGVDSVDGGNSVLHYMVTLAGIFGSNPIYLGGVDFGYPKGKAEDTHATGTFHPWPAENQMIEHAHQEGMELPANDGGTIMSSPAYKNFGTFLGVQVERIRLASPDLKVYTFSKRGLKVDGVELVDIGKWATS